MPSCDPIPLASQYAWKWLFLLTLSIGCNNSAKLAMDVAHQQDVERANITNYEVSPAGVALIKHFEGLRKEPYVCPGGALTVGYGQVIASQEKFDAEYPDGFSEKDAEDLLRDSLATVYKKDIERIVWTPLSQREFDVLVSLDYNIGATTLSNPATKSQNDWQTISLLPLLNASCYEEASLELPKFTKGGPEKKYYRGLLKRRMTEMFVFRNSTSVPQGLRAPVEDPNFRELTNCSSIAEYWEDGKQQRLRDEATLLYHQYNARLEAYKAGK